MSVTATGSRTEALDVLVELLSEPDDASGGLFYDRLCEAVCRLTAMERSGLYLYDHARKLVVPVGCHGIERRLLEETYGTIEETPIAERALSEDRVLESSERLEQEIPARYVRFAGITTITCTPVAAGGRWLGVLFADRGGGRFALTDDERHALWLLGKTAALATSARIATSQHERARLLSERIQLAREIHERVIQRLFAASLVIGSQAELSAESRTRCAQAIECALAELRTALTRPLASTDRHTRTTLRDELVRLGRHYKEPPLEVHWDVKEALPERIEPLAQAILAEALRNADKHARPSWLRVRAIRVDGTFRLEVRNDGIVGANRRRAGMGLRLAADEALQCGGILEFGEEGTGEWRVRLVVPTT